MSIARVSMRLSELIDHVSTDPIPVDVPVSGLALDSRMVQPGDVFLAVQGHAQDGREYIQEAIHKGASAILVDRSSPFQYHHDSTVPILPIAHLKTQVGLLASSFFNYPAQHLTMIGVTGTSGKTSCTHFLGQAFHHLKQSCGLIGTLGQGVFGQLVETGLTTPDAITLHRLLRQFVDRGIDTVAMEVSSHSIDQHRVSHIPYRIGIFTNLSQDHLDYHHDMAQYASVKRRFIAEFPLEHRIINMDDPYGKRWISELAGEKSIIAYGLRKSLALPSDVLCVYAEHIEYGEFGIKASIVSPWGSASVTIPLIGPFNLSNALAVFAALCVYGIAFDDAMAVLPLLQTVPGRMQSLPFVNKPHIVVDYAHKPDALEKVLQALRAHTKGKLICLFGCGGDRDQSKRALMGSIAERCADIVLVTNDNPRTEDPDAIIADIRQGFMQPEHIVIEKDRASAIKQAITMATPEDCVLLAGKGAERYQQVGQQKIPFDDLAVAQSVLDTLSIIKAPSQDVMAKQDGESSC